LTHYVNTLQALRDIGQQIIEQPGCVHLYWYKPRTHKLAGYAHHCPSGREFLDIRVTVTAFLFQKLCLLIASNLATGTIVKKIAFS
jgi:hypothetical protein